MAIKEDMLIFVDSNNNNNKYYHMVLQDNGMVDIDYGRVGSGKQTTRKSGGEREYNKILNSKLKKGYEKSSVVLNNQEIKASKHSLLELAMSQIQHSSEVVKSLIQRLVDKNIHNITASTNISFNKDNNLFMTPLGPVTEDGINQAKELLNKLFKFMEKNNWNDMYLDPIFIKLNEDYFKLIPTKIANLRNKRDYMLLSPSRISYQMDICDTLKQTFDLLKEKPIENKEFSEQVFQVKINLLEDKKVFKQILDKFNDSKNKEHGSRVNNLTIENIYELEIGNEKNDLKSDLGNVWELWHGTKVVNILSILKSGLLMPKETPGQKTGAMFGNGLYFSDQSTKSLNYCDGMFWNNSVKQDRVYMFLAEVVMGNYKIPKGSVNRPPENDYHSYFAKAGESGVRNNEMIVFDTKQVRLQYLLELKAINL